MRFIESIGGKDDPKAAAPLKRMRTMLIHVYRKGGEDPTTNNNHDEITTIFDYYFGDGDETTDITTEEAWIDLVDDIKHTNFDDIDTN